VVVHITIWQIAQSVLIIPGNPVFGGMISRYFLRKGQMRRMYETKFITKNSAPSH